MNSKYFLATICLFISSFHTVRADDRWIAFRNDGTNHSNAADLPVKWSPSNGIAWQKELPGYGQSSPLLWDGCLYLTEVRGPMKNQSVIIAIDSSSGELKWECPVETTEKDANYDQRCRAASTPVVDEAGVYAFFSGGDLFSVSHQGKLRWKRQLTKEYGKFQNGHGLGSSLAQTSDSVIVLIDHEGPSYLLAVDKQTGKNKWKVDRKQRTSWTSPVVANLNGRKQVVVSSNGSVDGYDAATGNLIWSLNDIGGNSISSATAQGDRVFIGASSSGFDGRNASGRSLCLEFLAGATEPKIAWRAEEASCHYVSVLANDRLTWHVNKTGVVCCVGIDGKTRFRKRTLGQCWATPLLVNELVYLFAKDGRTTVLESGEFYKEVTVNQLWDTKNPPAPETYVQSRPKPTGHGNAMQQAFEQLKQSDHNSDGKIEKEELPEQLRPFFPQLDTNQDGMIDKKEIDAMEARMRQSTTSSPSYGDPIVYGVAVGDGAFFVRTGTRIYCVRKSH